MNINNRRATETGIIPFYPSSDKILIKSKGCCQFDSDGRKYVDFEAGVWCANLGHSHPRIVKVLQKQLNESIHHGYNFRNEHAERLSAELQDLIGFKNGGSVFLSSGSEAVNLGITIARHITNRKKIIKIDNSYLSAYGFGQIRSDNEWVINVKFNDLNSLEVLNFSEVAAFVLETGGASVDVVQFPSYEYVKQLTELARRYNCLVISDEVTTGFGRLGKWFGYQHYDVEPDVVVTGKALGNGYPVSAVTVSSYVLQQLNHNSFRYAQSHQNDPLGCAAALEVINVIREEDLIHKSVLTGNYFFEQLSELYENNRNVIREVRGRGLMLAVEFSESFDGESLNRKLFENGYVVGFKNNTLRFLPPLIIENHEIDAFILKLKELVISAP